MNVVVTGEIGIGKTTVCAKAIMLLKNFGLSCGGIISGKSVDEEIFAIDIGSGDIKRLATTIDIYSGPHAGKFFFSPHGIDFGMRALSSGVKSDILFVDELGYLEQRGGGFAGALDLMAGRQDKPTVLVVRKQLLPIFAPRIGGNQMILEVTLTNRNELPQKMALLLNDIIKSEAAIRTPQLVSAY